jgi:uncharacterized paraquat-inducible protein A
MLCIYYLNIIVIKNGTIHTPQVTHMATVQQLEQLRTPARRSYAAGYKYCSRCRTYHLTDSVRCPYCGILLRNSPRKKKPVDSSKYIEPVAA